VSYCSAELDIYRTDYRLREVDGFEVIANSALAELWQVAETLVLDPNTQYL